MSGAHATTSRALPELRIDPLSGQRAIVAGERSLRPGGEPTCSPAQEIDREHDPFADGHEHLTPPELYAVRPDGGPPDSPGWRVRVVPNKYPALEPRPAQGERAAEGERDEAPAPARGPVELFQSRPATGAHEVIVNAPDPVVSLSELAPEQVAEAVAVWRERMRAHADSAYVQLIVNERREAGASLPHTHAQLYAVDFVPPAVARERERFGAYWTQMMGQDLLADLVAREVRERSRVVAIDEEAVLIAPYASRLPFQLMLAPRAPQPRFEEASAGAALLHDGLARLARRLGSPPPLNLWVRTAPRGAEHFCWRIDIVPRLTHIAGLELSTELSLNIVAPERAAELLRDA